MIKQIAILSLIFIILNISFVIGEEEKVQMNLKDCINMALSLSPDVIQAKQNILSSDASVKLSLVNYYPITKFTAQYYVTDASNAFVSSGGTIINSVPAQESHSTTFSVNQVLFDSFKTWYRYKYALAQRAQSEYTLSQVEDNLALTIATDYFNALTSQNMVILCKTLLEQATTHLNQAQANYDAGIAPKSDVYTTQVQVTQAKVNLLDAENSLKIKIATLKSDICMKRESDIELIEQFVEFKDKPGLSDAFNIAMEKRPELKEINAQIEGQTRQIDLACVNAGPQLNVGVGLSCDMTRTPGKPQNTYNASAVFVFPIFDGFSGEAQIEQARATLANYEAQKTNVEKQISLDVETAYYNLETAYAKISLTSEQVDEARKNLEVADGKYVAGVGPIRDVTDAQTTYARAMTEFINAKYKYQIALFTFKKALGEDLL